MGDFPGSKERQKNTETDKGAGREIDTCTDKRDVHPESDTTQIGTEGKREASRFTKTQGRGESPSTGEKQRRQGGRQTLILSNRKPSSEPPPSIPGHPGPSSNISSPSMVAFFLKMVAVHFFPCATPLCREEA